MKSTIENTPLKAKLALELRAELAQFASMGISTLHHHFRMLTSMSPRQYQKQSGSSQRGASTMVSMFPARPMRSAMKAPRNSSRRAFLLGNNPPAWRIHMETQLQKLR
jgi:hypothetical protein